MRKLIICIVLVLLIITTSCSKKENLSKLEVTPPIIEATKIEHKIVGKWTQNLDEKRIVELNFSEDGNLKVHSTYFGNNKTHEDTEDYKYQMLDENKVEFDYKSNGIGEPLVIVGELAKNKLQIQCVHKFDRKKRGIISPPMLCWYNNFRKIE